MTLKKYYNKNLLLLRFRWGEDPTISLRLPPLMFNITWAKLINPFIVEICQGQINSYFYKHGFLSYSDLTQPFTQLHNFGLLKFGLMRLNYLTFVFLIVNNLEKYTNHKSNLSISLWFILKDIGNWNKKLTCLHYYQ